MQEKSLQTTTKQRVMIIIITVLLLVSTFGVYVLLVLNGKLSSGSASIEALTERYNSKYEEVLTANVEVSDKYFDEFAKYRSNVKAYNEANATNGVLDTKDLKVGTGRELGEGDLNYAAYYIGWCADGEVFDSSFNTSSETDGDIADANALLPPLFAATMTEDDLLGGWNKGVVGMKVGGVRQITMNGDQAYGERREVCGGFNKPLRFIVMLVEPGETLENLIYELNDIEMELYAAYLSGSASSGANGTMSASEAE